MELSALESLQHTQIMTLEHIRGRRFSSESIPQRLYIHSSCRVSAFYVSNYYAYAPNAKRKHLFFEFERRME